MSKVWKLHKHFLTSLGIILFFAYFLCVGNAVATSLSNNTQGLKQEITDEVKNNLKKNISKMDGSYYTSTSSSSLSSEEYDKLSDEEKLRHDVQQGLENINKQNEFNNLPTAAKQEIVYNKIKEDSLKKIERCSFCGLFTVFYNTASVVTQTSINTFSRPMMQLLVVAFAVWIALQIVTFVSAPEVRDLKDLMSSIINKSFIIMILVGLLSTGAINFFNNFLNPIYTTGQKLAQTIITPDEVIKNTTLDKAINAEAKTIPQSCKGNTEIYDKDKGALPKAMGDSILCTMELIQSKANVIKDLGAECLKESWSKRIRVVMIPHFGYLFVGLGLWIGAMLIILSVPFIMIDVVFQMAVAGALLPFGIAAFAFKPTSGYSKKIWETFLNSVFAFIFVSLISLMLCELFIETVVDNYGSTNVNNVLTNIPWFGVEFLKVCFVCILAWAILPTAKDFAKEFSGAISSTKFGEGAATIAASATKSFAVKAGKETLEAAVTNTGKAIKSGFGMAVGGIRNSRRNKKANNIINDKEATGGNGRWQKKSDKKTSVVTQSSTGAYVLDEKNKNGSRKIRTEDFTIVTDKHGNTSVRYNTHDARNMFDDSGKLEKGKDGTRFGEIQGKYEKEYNIAKKRFEDAKQRGFKSDEEEAQLKEDMERAGFILTATTQAAIEQRMPYASKKTGGKELKRAPQFDDNGKYIGYDAVMEDGSVRKIRINMSAPDKSGKSRLYTEVTNIDKNGKGETLRSNGMIQAKSTFKTKDGKANGEIDDESRKTSYSLSAHHEYRRQNSRGGYLDREMQNGGTFGFSSDEAKAINYVVANGGARISEFGSYHA